MKRFFTRQRLSMTFSILGITLMGVDLMVTRNFFSHVGEIMVLSLLCLVTGIVLSRQPKEATSSERKKARHQARVS